MFLSKIALEPCRSQAHRLLADVYAQHRFVMSGFPDRDGPQRTGEASPPVALYRLEVVNQGRGAYILIQSTLEPDLERVYDLHPGAVKTALSTQYNPTFEQGDRLRFRLRANPTRSYCNRDQKGVRNPRRGGLFREVDQRDWLARIAERSGFQVDTDAVLITPRGQLTGTKFCKEANNPRHQVECFAVDFDGQLTISDEDIFAHSVKHGVGRAKAFGFGLLSLARS